MSEVNRLNEAVDRLEAIDLSDAPALRTATTPADWEANATSSLAAAKTLVEQAAFRSVIGATMLQDATGYTWRYDGQRWEVWNGATWDAGTPEGYLTPMHSGFIEAPEVPESLVDQFPACPTCGARNPAGVLECRACGADTTQAPGELWQCADCERWNASSCLNCPACGGARTSLTPESVIDDPTVGAWLQDVTAATTASAEVTTVVEDETPPPVGTFCRSCGDPVAEGVTYCQRCLGERGLLPRGDGPKLICAACKAPWDGSRKFCNACGVSMSGPNAFDIELPPDPEPASAITAGLAEEPVAPAAAVCANCGTALEETIRFCTSCGSPREARPVTPPAALVCPGCQAALTPEQRFCMNCGTAVA